MLDFMKGQGGAASEKDAGGGIAGDWLSVFSTLFPHSKSAALHQVRRLPDVASILSGRSYPFPGARLLKVISVPGGETLAMKAISANAPVVSDVALQGPPNPVSVVVTLAWAARDAGRFRVVANVHTGFADSPSHVFTQKPPAARILLLLEGTRLHWGQLINFLGEADDAQDGSLADSGLRWFLGRRILGNGSAISIDNLPVGENLVTLRAQVPAGSVAKVAAQLQISNSGSGAVNWTISESAPWLEAVADGLVYDVDTLPPTGTGFKRGDSNSSGKVDISDAVAALAYLFLGQATPPAPGPDACGGDPTPDPLGACATDPAKC